MNGGKACPNFNTLTYPKDVSTMACNVNMECPGKKSRIVLNM